MKYFLLTLLFAAAGIAAAAEKKPSPPPSPYHQAQTVVKESTRWLTGPTMAGYEEGCRILDEAIPVTKGGLKTSMIVLKCEWLCAMKKFADAEALAAQHLQESPKMFPRDKARLICVRGRCCFDQEKWAEAMAFYTTVDPQMQFLCLFEMATASMALGKYKDAEMYLDLLVKRGTAQKRLYGAALENLKKFNGTAPAN